MAQSTTSKYSSPVVRPAFSLYKSAADEGRQPTKGTPAMATGAAKKSQRQARLTDEQQPNQPQQEQQPVNTQPASEQIPVTTFTQVTLADMMAQRRALTEQIKTVKASTPKVEKPPKPSKNLDDVASRQAETVGIGHTLYIASRAMARVKLGQDVDSAVNDVTRREGQAAMGAIDLFMTGDYASMRDALMHWAAENAPLTVTKQHTQIIDGDESSDTTGK